MALALYLVTAERAARRVRRQALDARRIARRLSMVEFAQPVRRIYGEPIVADLGERRLALMGFGLAVARCQDALDDLSYFVGLARAEASS